MTLRTFEEFVQYNMETGLYSADFIANIKKVIGDQKIKLFYPRNLYNTKKEKEFIFFLDNSVLFAYLEDGTTRLEFSKVSYQHSIKINIPRHIMDYGIELTFGLANGKGLTLNSLNDSNESFYLEYAEALRELYKFLLTK